MTSGLPLRQRDTVETDTPAIRAMSAICKRRRSAASLSSDFMNTTFWSESGRVSQKVRAANEAALAPQYRRSTAATRHRPTAAVPPHFTVTEKFFAPKFMPPAEEVISKPYCTSPTTRSPIQPRFFR